MSHVASPARVSPARSSWTKRSRLAVLVAATLMLEVVPVSAWLRVTSGEAGVPGNTPGLPLPALFLMALAGWAGGWVMERSVRSVGLAVAIASYVLAAGIAFFFAPALANGHLGSITVQTTAQRDGLIVGVVGILAFTLYIWWRGLAVGTVTPGPHGTLMRFRISFAALILAILMGAVTLPDNERGIAMGAMAVLLPVEMLSGLLAMSVARLRERQQHIESQADSDGPWLRTAVLLSVVLVGFVLLLSVVVNYESVVAILRQFGPLGTTVANAMNGLMNALASGLYALLSPLHLPNQTVANGRLTSTTMRGQTGCPSGTGPNCTQTPAVTEALIQIITAILVIIGFLYILRWALLRRGERPVEEQGVTEVRESLDATGLLGSQMRSLFQGMFRRKEQSDIEALAPGSIRYLYREVLRAAEAGQHGRRPDETPDEFAERLTGEGTPLTVPDATADLATISAAYTEARYGERQPGESARGSLASAVRRLTRQLRARPARQE